MTGTRDHELPERLREQVAFIRSSAAAFDEGAEHEAKRLATSVRVLVHDTGASRSLLGQLGIKATLLYLDSSDRDRPPPPPGTFEVRWSPGLAALRLGEPGGPRYVPRLEAPVEDGTVVGPVPFDDWWTRPILQDVQGNTFCRRDLVLAMAHKEGGAHVDLELDAAYAALSRSNSLGWFKLENAVTVGLGVVPDGVPMPSPVPANVRQIAFELERTLVDQLPDLLGWASASS